MKKEKEKNLEDLENTLDNIDLSEKTELEGVGEQIFKRGDSRSNLEANEIALILTCDMIFPVIGMKDHNPTNNFKELSKSRSGWSTEKFVQAVGGAQDQRSGGSIGGWMKDRLFTPKG